MKRILNNRYKVGRQLGAGGFANVYEAEDTHLNRLVAIKVLRESIRKSASERFRREAYHLDKLRHPNIISVYDAELEATPAFLVMELLQGYDLEESLQSGPISLCSALSIVCQIGRALDYLNSEGILHRDIKPANIFIEGDRAVLMDFNLLLASDLTALTKTGMIVGTPQYMAPEIFFGASASIQSDICSLGLVLFQMLAPINARLKFEEFGPRKEELPPLAALNEELNRNVDVFIAKATALDTDRRHQSFSSFVEEAENLITKSSVTFTEDVSPLPQLKVHEEGERKLWPFPIIIVALLLLLFSLSNWRKKSYSVRELSVESGPKALHIKWHSDLPYPSVVEVVGSNVKRVGTLNSPSCKRHSVMVGGLVSNRFYLVRVIYPDGNQSLSKKVRTTQLALSDISLNGAKLSFGCPQAKELQLLLQYKNGNKKQLLGEKVNNHWETNLGQLSSQITGMTVELTPTIGVSKHNLNVSEFISAQYLEKTKPLLRLNGSSFCKKTRTLVEKHPNVKKEREKVRGVVIRQLIEQNGYDEAWSALKKVSPFVFSTSVLSFETQKKFHSAYVRGLELSLYTYARKTIPPYRYSSLPTLGEFSLTTINRPYQKRILLYEDFARRRYFGPAQIDFARKFIQEIKTECVIEDPCSYQYAEIVIKLGRIQDYLIRLIVNNDLSLPLFDNPYINATTGQQEQYVQRIPIQALTRGKNSFNFRAEQVFDALAEKIVRVREISLRLY